MLRQKAKDQAALFAKTGQLSELDEAFKNLEEKVNQACFDGRISDADRALVEQKDTLDELLECRDTVVSLRAKWRIK